jgi:thymidylate synthase (FAD)
MKFVTDSFEFIPQQPGIEGMYGIMELAARTCYKTENLIKEGTAHKIIDNVIIPHGHTSVLEFGTVYLYGIMDVSCISDGKEWWRKYQKDRFSRVSFDDHMDLRGVYITTTYRTIMQGDYTDPEEAIKNGFDKNWKDDLKYWSEPTQYHHKRYCYRFIMDRVGSQSVVRHRGVYGISYAQESTRYINYNRDKFDHDILVSLPQKFYSLIEEWSKCVDSLTNEDYSYIKDLSLEDQLIFLRTHDRGWVCYEDSMQGASDDYMYLTGVEGWKPEDARGVLPLDIKTEFMMCAYPEDWKFFLFRRTDKHAHPHIQKIANELKDDTLKRF